VAAKNGVLVKGATVWEAAKRIDTVIFDKTGSLTVGKLHVVDMDVNIDVLGDRDRKGVQYEVLECLAAAESNSEHLVAKALLKYAVEELGKMNGGTPSGAGFSLDVKASEFVAFPGLGVECRVTFPSANQNKVVLVGNLTLMNNQGVVIPAKVETFAGSCSQRGNIPIYVAIDGLYRALVVLSDVLRDESRSVVNHLLKRGVDVWLVSGDMAPAVESVALDVGIPLENVRASVLPEGKAQQVKALRDAGHVVVMVGDGCNDAAALAVANVGIAIGGGTEMATTAAGVVLMRDHLEGVIVVTELARSVARRIVINLCWAFGYNLIAIPLAMGFFWPLGVYIPPAIAGASELASSVPVIVLALLLGLWRLRYHRVVETFSSADIEKFMASFRQ
jgi:Cu+-exporting ATPase